MKGILKQEQEKKITVAQFSLFFPCLENKPINGAPVAYRSAMMYQFVWN